MKQLTVNDELIEPFPFRREISMQAYLIDNPEILNIDDMYSDVQIYNDEVVLDGGKVRAKGGNGRIDIVAAYAGEHIAIVELKNVPLEAEHLEQLEDYIRSREQLKNLDPSILTTEETTNPKWLGILVGNKISNELRDKISNGYAYEEQESGDKIPIAAMTIQRFRSKTGQVYVTTDTYFKNTISAKDRTKYSFNGNVYRKGRLVLAIIRHHVSTKHIGTYSKLEHDFPLDLQGSSGTFCTLDKANNRYSESGYKRHYIAPDEVVELADGVGVAVSTQWGIGNIDKFIKHAKDQHGYTITAL